MSTSARLNEFRRFSLWVFFLNQTQIVISETVTSHRVQKSEIRDDYPPPLKSDVPYFILSLPSFFTRYFSDTP